MNLVFTIEFSNFKFLKLDSWNNTLRKPRNLYLLFGQYSKKRAHFSRNSLIIEKSKRLKKRRRTNKGWKILQLSDEVLQNFYNKIGSLGFFQCNLYFSFNLRISGLDLADLMSVDNLFFLKLSILGLFILNYFGLEFIYRAIELAALLFKFGYFEILQIKCEIPIFVFSYLIR